MTVTATDERVTGKVKIAKIDKETLAFKAQGDSVLRGAVYGLYAKEDIVHPDGTTGVLYKQDSLIAQGVIGDDGTLEFSELYLGEMYVKEITPPEGYTLDTTKYEVSVTYEGQDVAEVTRDLTVKEQVKKQAFQLIKISEDGEQTETDLVAGAGFKVYLISDLTQVKNGKLKPANGESYTASDFKNYDFSKEQVAVTYENGTAVPVPELITDTKGYAVSPELPYGSYVVVESINKPVINRKNVINAFAEYVRNYDPSDEKIKLKIDHTYRVAGLCQRIAESLGLSEPDVDIAWLLGMLHDIGRFEQIRRFGTFNDVQSVDHAEFGADLLFKEGLIRKFAEGYYESESCRICYSSSEVNNYCYWYGSF